jgi:hypothetical protein
MLAAQFAEHFFLASPPLYEISLQEFIDWIFYQSCIFEVNTRKKLRISDGTSKSSICYTGGEGRARGMRHFRTIIATFLRV